MIRFEKSDFTVPSLLLGLSFVPVLGGLVRLKSLLGSAPCGGEDARFCTAPLPVVIHVVAATIYVLLGAFQFSTGIRRSWPTWHRRAGALLVGSAILTGATGVWMAAAYAIPTSLQGPLLRGMRLLVGAAMLTSIAKGWTSMVLRDFAQHEAWMIRAYALAQGAGTQAVIILPLMLVAGPVVGFTRDVLLSAAWVINVIAAELLIRRRRRTYARAPSPTSEVAAATRGS